MAANSNPKLSATRMSARISFIILVLAIVHSSDRSPVVKCQDFEDLNRPIGSNAAGPGGGISPPQQQQPQAFATFQPSRQFGQSQSPPSNQFQAAPQNTRQSLQRPVLSNRFAQQQQPQLGAQASTLSSAVLPSQQQQQQQTLPTTSSGQQSTPAAAAPGNIEQIMKGAQNRASKLEQTTSAESRQESSAVSQIQSRSGAQFQPAQTSASQSPKERSLPSSAATSSSESRAAEVNPSPEEPTTTPETTTTAHETVYSDQRFASLFARRGSQKKSKFMPTEQVKAKPTLPSFIKSPPDPKQFTPEAQETRPPNLVSSNLISARIQQQQSINQNRQLINQSTQKKPAASITSNTAASANNKRLNSQKQQAAASTPLKASNASRSAGSQQSANVTNKPNPVNPFNKSQQSNSDPANVIAMARRRLLANNALQQQQRPTVK